MKETGAMAKKEGLYLYGVAARAQTVNFGTVGIDGSEVYSIPSGDFSAIVHCCAAEPYQSADRDTVAKWVLAHQRVVEKARETFSTVIPAGFDTILYSGERGDSAEQALTDWLRGNSARLAGILRKIRGKDEFGVQVYCSQPAIVRQMPERTRQLDTLAGEISATRPGTAFLHRRLLERDMRAAIEARTKKRAGKFYERIKPHCDDTVIEKTGKAATDRVMLLNLSCLVEQEKVSGLAEELEQISRADGLLVRFTGPWPPYSFVSMPELPASEGALP